jgi:F-type H+-transporting ATPase subunit b
MSGLGINVNLLIAQVVNFLIVLVILRMVLYRPVMNMFAQRRERIRTALEEAERAREEAAEERARFEAQLAEERRASQDRLREAASKGEEAARRRLEEANAEADRLVQQARTEAEQTRRQALAGLHDEIAEIALAAAAKALGDGIDEAKHRQLIDRFLRDSLGELA